MGCAQTKQNSMQSPPRGLEKLKLENGYVKRGHVGARRSTSQRHSGGSNGAVYRNGNGINNGMNGRFNFGAKEDEKDKMINKKKEREIYGNDNGNVSERVSKAGEDELVDGWPKWLTDNIPRDALRGIVPKSADSYEKLDKVGQGTYSNVYKAREKDTGKIVALKKVRFDTSESESVKFMAREIMILQKLDHPNVVKLEGLATSRMQYSLYLVFEYMHSDLARIISRPDERLTEPQIKCYMQQLLSGLQHCHDRGILHRDIKGSNLLIDRNGMLKIADFGLANYFNPKKRRPLTSRVVTLWYRAPELLLGCTDYGVGIDLWSAGCLLAEMFAGRPIMPGRTEVEQLHRIFKLCGTPSDEFWQRLKLSAALKPPLKPPQSYKTTLRESFRSFPESSLGLLHRLLALDPTSRGSAASALQDEFFHTSPLACDLSGLPVIHIEDDIQYLTIEKRKKPRRKLRSQSHKEQRKRDPTGEKQKGKPYVSNEEPQKSSGDTSVFSLEPGSSTSTSSSAKPSGKEESPPPITTSVVGNYMSPRNEAHRHGTRSIKNRPPLPIAKAAKQTVMIKNTDSVYRYEQVQRSISSREFRGMENINLLNAVD